MLFFSSTEDIGVNNGTLSYKEWINCNKGIDLKIQELSEYQNFDFAPYVISLEYEELKSINEVFFKETLKIKHKGFLLSWPFYDKGIYFLLYRDEILLPNNNLPSQMTSVLEVVRMKWLEYFSHSFNTNLPRIDVSEIVESLVDFKDIAKYYPCTKM
jgi:hypothetical protein